jgi:hypothetical protein
MAEDFELNCRLISRAELIKRRIGMRPGTVCLAARQDAQRSLAAVKEMAKTRGEAYLKFAKQYLSQRHFRNAKAAAVEGKRLCEGPFYLAVQEQLDGVLRDIEVAEAVTSQPIPPQGVFIFPSKPSAHVEELTNESQHRTTHYIERMGLPGIGNSVP